jgi:diaminohydroxyphosphoribosylaminopyrimidine deaminase/5-amino-6-(5-phosphoribosylamino)uracil reductase
MIEDTAFMQHALNLAKRGLGNTFPNPAVGCVIVKEGKIIGRGWTQPSGRPHAETEALKQAGDKASGATAYVTLEPCAHYGKTPPCAEALIKAGVARVVVAVHDVDARVAGRGIAMLKQAGIVVTEGVLEKEALALNVGFFKKIKTGMPLVAVKVASSLDGKIALKNGASQWITSPEARAFGHKLRAEYDAILVGTNTVLADNPRLNCRLQGLEKFSPIRVVLDKTLKIPETYNVFDGTQPTYCVVKANTHPPESFLKKNVLPIALHLTEKNQLPLRAMLEELAKLGITRLLVEGGAAVISSLHQDNLIDRWYWFTAPKILGNEGKSSIADLGLTEMPDTLGNITESKRFGDTLLQIIDTHKASTR